MQLNQSQISAAYCDAPNILAIAGPGAGKTRTLVERIKRLIRDGRDARGFVIITFTNAAADEMLKRLSEDGDAPRFGYIGTLHGFILRSLSGCSRLSIVDEELRIQILDEVAREMRFNGSSKDIVKAVSRGPRAKAETRAERVALAYFQRLRDSGMMDFDCILHEGLTWAEKQRDTIAQQEGASNVWKFSHLFVDEYQDSGPIDAAIYEVLPIPNKFFVGDPDQSIYSFRGGSVRFIEAKASNPQTVTIKLQENFRSTKSICAVAQRLIEHNAGRIPKDLIAMTDAEGEVVTWRNDAHMMEVARIADAIKAEPNAAECAVLVRSNAMAKHFTAGLESFGVQVKRRQQVTVPHDWKLCRMAVALLANPDNDAVAFRLLCHMQTEDRAKDARATAARLFMSINAFILHLTPCETLTDLPELLARFGVSAASIEVVQLVARQMPQDATVLELSFALAGHFAPAEAEGGGVTVTTIHGAKGLEWDCVFCPAFEQASIPGTTKSADVQEERRLAFVAFTRARRKLVVSYASQRPPPWSKTGRLEPTQPSQFLDEAGLAI